MGAVVWKILEKKGAKFVNEDDAAQAVLRIASDRAVNGECIAGGGFERTVPDLICPGELSQSCPRRIWLQAIKTLIVMTFLRITGSRTMSVEVWVRVRSAR